MHCTWLVSCRTLTFQHFHCMWLASYKNPILLMFLYCCFYIAYYQHITKSGLCCFYIASGLHIATFYLCCFYTSNGLHLFSTVNYTRIVPTLHSRSADESYLVLRDWHKWVLALYVVLILLILNRSVCLPIT